jgi:hypothetical protein
MKKLIIFDLDGTLAESKADIDDEMAGIFCHLLHVAKVAIISGGDWPQFEKQVLSHLPKKQMLSNLFILPTCGTKYYQYKSGWKKIYSEDFSDDEKKKITDNLSKAVITSNLKIIKTWGEQIEDRGSQITFSALGQQAPIEAKKKWDPDFGKRRKIKAKLHKTLPEFSVEMGGATSIDITRPGIDKAYGIQASGKQRDQIQMINTPEGMRGVRKQVGLAKDESGAPVQARNMGMESRIAGAQEQQKGNFTMQYDPTLGRSRPFSKWELRQQLEAGGPSSMPATPAEAAKVNAIAGRQIAVFNASENTRQAARNAIEKNGKLSFKDGIVDPNSGTTLSQMAGLIARLTHSNDVVDSNLMTSYMHGLVNSAMDQDTRNYANHLLTMYEAAVGANSIVGGSNQTSDMRYRALLAALPSPVDQNLGDIEGKINRFETDVALSMSSMPNIKASHGYSVQDINRDLQEIHAGKPYAESIIGRMAGSGGVTLPKGQTLAPAKQQPQAAPSRGAGNPNDLKKLSTEELLRSL